MLVSQNDFQGLILMESETANIFISESMLPEVSSSNSSSRSNPKSMAPIGFIDNNMDSGNSLGSNNSLLLPLESSKLFSAHSSLSANSPGRNNRLNSQESSFRLERFPSVDIPSSPLNALNHDIPIRWKRGNMLGKGAFGVVYEGLNIDTGEIMAVKQLAIDEVSKRTLSSLENEIHFLRSLGHQNIVRYIGTATTATALSIFLEYAPGGSLKSLIDKFGLLEEPVTKSYTRQLLLGLEYLHRHGIAHRDIKGKL